jgi:predicted enzyme related to lactoylglutathione lyase
MCVTTGLRRGRIFVRCSASFLDRLTNAGCETRQRMATGAGGVITQAPFEFPGGRRFHFRDPSGNELAVWSDR